MREKRKYLHSTDIFEQITNLKKNSQLLNIDIFFKNQINNIPFIIIQYNPSEIKRNQSNVYFKFKMKKKIFFGYIFESKKKIHNIRRYNEKIFQKMVKIDNNIIYIPNSSKFNFIEKITSGAMKFLKKKSPEKKNKWYLASLNLKSFFEKKKFIRLKLISLKKIKTFALFDIIANKNKIGKMIFIKK
mgnify:CR=1 FL=1